MLSDRGIQAATTILSSQRATGADDIEYALQDLLCVFEGRLEPEELANCVVKLQNSVMAPTWRNLSQSLKEIFVTRWKKMNMLR